MDTESDGGVTDNEPWASIQHQVDRRLVQMTFRWIEQFGPFDRVDLNLDMMQYRFTLWRDGRDVHFPLYPALFVTDGTDGAIEAQVKSAVALLDRMVSHHGVR